MAKGLARKMFPREFHVDSAGTDSGTTGSANFKAVSVMGEYGIDLTSHLAKSVTDVPISEFDHIVAMDSNIFDYFIRKYPDMEDRTIQWQIDDPFYMPIDSYRSCAEQIHHNLRVLSARLGLSTLDSKPTSEGKNVSSPKSVPTSAPTGIDRQR
jgi:protein-tyrosine-phosphatase